MNTFTHGIESLLGDNEHRSIGAVLMECGHYVQVFGEYIADIRGFFHIGITLMDIAQSIYRYADNHYARDFSTEHNNRGVMAVLAENGRWYVQCYTFDNEYNPTLHHEYPARDYSDAWDWTNAWIYYD